MKLTSFFDKNDEIIHWVRISGAIQQKRFKKRHMGPYSKPKPSTQEETTDPVE